VWLNLAKIHKEWFLNDLKQSNKLILQYFKSRYKLDLSSGDLEEIRQSLFHLGRAWARYNTLKNNLDRVIKGGRHG